MHNESPRQGNNLLDPYALGVSHGQHSTSRSGVPRGACEPLDSILRYGAKGPDDDKYLSGFLAARAVCWGD